jgi:molecular chaperone GrpE (heat shock protein)
MSKKPPRVFDVSDESYSTEEAKVDRLKRIRALQEERSQRAEEALARWRTRLKRAQGKVKELERRTNYYRRVLAVKP